MTEIETYYKSATIVKEGKILRKFQFKWIDVMPFMLRFRDIKPKMKKCSIPDIDAYYIGNISYDYDLNRRECYAHLYDQNIDIIINF